MTQITVSLSSGNCESDSQLPFKKEKKKKLIKGKKKMYKQQRLRVFLRISAHRISELYIERNTFERRDQKFKN